jgi:hypothetical protein
LPHARLHQQSPHKAPTPQTGHSLTCSVQSSTNPIGAKVQRAEVDTTQPLTPKEIKRIQDIISTLLYYGRAVDAPLLAALSTIAARQANGTWAVADACHQHFSITLALTQMQAFDTERATWYFQYTQTPPTFPNLVVKAERQDISTYQITIMKTSTMMPYSHCQPSSNTP